ncbi:MAG TPA: hypothetical protein VGX78_09475 [Pirellulales bacterium]|nr:hypothetical protein [Pirellulales bacterium]
MNRIFTPLAVAALVMLLIALALGLGLRAYDIRDPHDRAAQQWATTHRLAGVGVGLLVVLVNSIVVTYFIGTSRWCKEVVATYSLDGELVRRSTRLKRRTFPFALASMLVVVVLIASGGAADPGGAVQVNARLDALRAAVHANANTQPSDANPTIDAPAAGNQTWANWHLAAATLGLGFIAYAFFAQGQTISENHQVIEEVMSEVKRIRAERGLEA